MSDQSFTTAFLVKQSPREAYAAIVDVRGWWSEEIEGGAARPGDEFTYRYGEVHRCKIRVTEAIPDRKISWLVLDNYFNFIEHHTEWIDTTIHFDISEQDEEVTEVRFTHQGLHPGLACFDACSDGWTFYINGSLRNLIATGKGNPNSSLKPQTAAEAVAARRDQ
ncbi:SRPBCC family protein [Amycolatopsis aidingensis]|uniref:SRPBCC family protein n=1 Tax=Amycolatopsis aidingensis TaxID=2842453 RepID=UPI001C0D753D|nr:SRPBCC domain-containing protein [Amycolatopsis aidingensis]